MMSGGNPAAMRSGAAAVLSDLAWRAESWVSGQPAKDTARLGLRLLGARAMSVVTLVVALWFVSVEDFATYGVYQALATLVSIAAFLRYDAAIVAASSEAAAHAVLRLCAALGGGTVLLVGAASLATADWGPLAAGLALLFPLSVVGRGALRLSFAAATRDGDFKGIGRASLVQAFIQPAVLVSLVHWSDDGALAFAGADAIGHAVAVVYLAWRKRPYAEAFRRGWSLGALAATARQWQALPLYNLPGSFLSLAFVNAPLLIMPLVASPVFAGHVALVHRIFDVPTQIITATAAPIFQHRMRPSAAGGPPVFRRLFMTAFVGVLFVIYAAMAAGLALVSPWLTGTSLQGIGGVVSVVAAFQLFVAIAAPLNDSCALYPQQQRLAAIHGVALAFSALSLPLALASGPRTALLGLVFLSMSRALALGELLRELSALSARKRSMAEERVHMGGR